VSGYSGTTFEGAPDRWRLCRFGAVNVWQYVDETIEVHDGKVVLFGVNGSGKTMLLEFVLPYLLDANGQPARLSTSGGNDRGGLWERAVGVDGERARPGFLWVEFVRTVAGADEHFTIGTRLAAKPSGGGDHAWFVTSRRAGRDLPLIDGRRVPLALDELDRHIGDTGTVFRGGGSRYRDTVRETLYPELSADQFAQMISTLLIVRRKNIAERLNPTYLNEMLTEGLPPLDPNEIGSVAAGFEELDRRHDQIEMLEGERTSASRLAGAVRAYARQVLARNVKQVTDTQTARDNVTRRRQRAERETQRLDGQIAATTGEVADLEGEQADLDGTLEGLRRSDAHKASELLGEAARRRDETAGTARRAVARADTAETAADTAAGEADTSAGEAATAAEALAAAARDVRDVAADVAPLSALTAETPDTELPEALRPAVAAHRANVKAVRALVGERDRRAGERDTLADRAGEAEHAIATQEKVVADARRDAADATGAWRADTGRWLAGLARLDAAALDGLEQGEPSAAGPAVAAVHVTFVRDVAGRRADQQATVRNATTERDTLTARRGQLADGTDPEPDAPTWRAPREGRNGLPLWRAVNPADGLDPDTLAGAEAALLAAGMLDAWVTPDGQVELDGEIADVFAAATEATAHDGPTLADWFEAAPDAPDHVSDWLASVPAGPCDAPVWVAGDGTFRVGPTTGRGDTSRGARHLGAAARAAARAAEIAAIDVRTGELDTHIADATARIAELDAAERAADTERASLPATGGIATAESALASADAVLASHEDALGALTVRLRAAEQAAEDADLELRRVASTAQLPTTVALLDDAEDELHVLDRALARLDQTVLTAASTARQADRDRATADQAATAAAGERTDAKDATEAARTARAEFDTLNANVGADVAEVHAAIATAKGRLEQVVERLRAARDEITGLAQQFGAAEKELSEAQDRYDEATAARDAAQQTLVDALRDNLLGDANVTVDGQLDSVADRREAARTIAAQVDEPFEARLLNQRQATVSRLVGEVGSGSHASFEPSDNGDWMLLTVRVEGRSFSARELTDHLADELDRARLEITEKEAELFERTLTGSVRKHLATRIRTAEDHKDRMNELMRGVRTAAGGVTAQLRWSVNGDVDDATMLRRARELLLSDLADPAEREELHTFLRRQIERARAAESETTSWQDRLETALDYRHWHKFDLMVEHDRHTDGPVRITSRKLGLSTGEATVVITLPLIAAVVAYYLPDGPDRPARTSPRLLLMDELFPTCDPENKRLFMRLLNDLDLDAVFTSDKDQCHYDTIDGIAIHHIHKDADGWAVSTRSVWNGRDILDAPVTEPAGQRALGLAGG
jgi:uncharacterized protein (TIGR02680 family)